MAATFNLLRGTDLIWNTVINHYLLGEDYPAFDLLHWNGDVTNLPAKWHEAYLRDCYRDNKLVEPDALEADGTPIDLRLIKTPAYVQAGREDHIAPPDSVLRMLDHLKGPKRFVLAGSGHIAGVVNPPGGGQVPVLDRQAARDDRGIPRPRHRASRAAGGPTGSPGSRRRTRRKSPPPASARRAARATR